MPTTAFPPPSLGAPGLRPQRASPVPLPIYVGDEEAEVAQVRPRLTCRVHCPPTDGVQNQRITLTTVECGDLTATGSAYGLWMLATVVPCSVMQDKVVVGLETLIPIIDLLAR